MINPNTRNYRTNPGKIVLAMMSGLPDINLLLQTKFTEDLMYEFLNQKIHNILLGELLTARFNGGANTAYEEKLKGNITEASYICIVEMANYLQSYFNLIQTFWKYIKSELVTTNPLIRYPQTDVILFQLMLEQMFNNKFIERTKGCKYTKKNAEKFSKLEVKYLRESTKLGSSFQRNQEIESQLDAIDEKAGTIPNTWHDFVFDVLSKHVAHDELLQTMLRRHIAVYADMKDRLQKLLEKDRKEKLGLSSIHYVNGIKCNKKTV